MHGPSWIQHGKMKLVLGISLVRFIIAMLLKKMPFRKKMHCRLPLDTYLLCLEVYTAEGVVAQLFGKIVWRSYRSHFGSSHFGSSLYNKMD